MTSASTSHVFHRLANSVPPLAVGASGIEIVDSTGKRYLDASGGAAVSCIGHGEPRVVEAIRQQAAALDYAHNVSFTSEAAEELAAFLCRATPLALEKVQFVGSGSEAVEAALKLARQFHIERGDAGRHVVISRLQSYHGNTLGALARGGNVARSRPYAPMMVESPRIEPCFEYHHRRPDESPLAYGQRAADALEEEILRIGSDKVAAFIAETVVGATSGAVPPAPGYFQRIREICDRYGILLILDEVMCGASRTGPFLACETEGIQPDIVTLAKGLGGGYQSIAAVMCTRQVHQAFAEGSGRFVHGHTFMAHPVACAAALAVQKVIQQDGLALNVARQGETLHHLLEARLGHHPHVGDIRGRGLLQAIEMVADRSSKQPFPSARGLAAAVDSECRARGLMVYPGTGTVDGVAGDHILLAPPYNVSREALHQIVDRLGDAVETVLGRT
ncbi:aspartate aminotransferase family protein [Halomonas kenyensis]|uniref:Aspartate aminotransferase family protein n=1 Tax=Billgrantia kenyensis TaxID=321266 RepID=A0A7V9W2X6_9GAMM|nr:aspartate aminotransferase family protein [Halomonas kenyensis]MBA2780093.1 aspartate aminotransferase family protein [Halomonas kenyensis]MCG6661966.1 aspartate aminotransferase family protein [Halomonas kenyensis]